MLLWCVRFWVSFFFLFVVVWGCGWRLVIVLCFVLFARWAAVGSSGWWVLGEGGGRGCPGAVGGAWGGAGCVGVAVPGRVAGGGGGAPGGWEVHESTVGLACVVSIGFCS